MFLILLAISVLLLLIHLLIHSTKLAKTINKIPGPSMIPVFGNALELLVDSVPLFYGTREMSNSVHRKINRFWVFNMPVVNVYDPCDIEVVLSSSKNIKKGFVYELVKPWLNEGLLTSSGEKWHARRKILTPTFHFNILKQFSLTLVEQSEKLVSRLQNEVGKPETEILPYITEFTLCSICETAMGTNFSLDNNAFRKYQDAIFKLAHYVIYRFVRPWLHSSFTFGLTDIGKKHNDVLKTLHTFSTNVIRRRREDRNISGNKLEIDRMFDGEESPRNKRLAMLDLLLSAEAENKIDEDGIREEVDTFMFEGHDTTTMAITFCLMLLANNPEIQDLVVKELDEIFVDPDMPVTIDVLNQMKYLERCIKEALRLYPSVPYIGRHITEDVQLKDYVLPAGTSFDLHIFDIHRREELYPNPDKFDPDRFLPENCLKRHPYAYLPFSAGPRNCIGQKFAILEEKAVISAILRKFILKPITKPDDIIFITDFVLRPHNPIKIQFINRN